MAPVNLSCTLCPKKPIFSDLSHLLTHLASKGHLSHYFKAQVKSRQDQQVARALQAFDEWYSESDMDKLLHERLMQKEKKQPVARVRNTVPRSQKPNSSSNDVPASLTRRHTGPLNSMKDAIDPRLNVTAPSSPPIKPENTSYIQSISQPAIPLSTLNEYFSPNSDGLGATPRPASRRYFSQHNSLPDMEPHGNSRKAVNALHANNHLALSRVSKEEGNISADVTDQNNTESSGDNVSLKGVFWPGMDLFDSASPHAKRIRNQKKDLSCLGLMQKYADTIEPNEDIYFYPSWELKQSREITGQVESSSPEREASPPRPRKVRARGRKPKERAPLMPLDVNQPVPQRPGRLFVKHETLENYRMEDERYDSRYLQHSRPESIFHDDFSRLPPTHSDMNWSLGLDHELRAERKRTISVFRDDDCLSPGRRAPFPSMISGECKTPQTPCPQSSRQISGYSGMLKPSQSYLHDGMTKPPNTTLYSGEEKGPTDSMFDVYGSFFDNRRTDCQPCPDFELKRFSNVSSTAMPGYSYEVGVPYTEFLTGYQMPMQSLSPLKSTLQTAGCMPNSCNVSMIPHAEQIGCSSNPTNSLIDFTNFVGTKSCSESDDETIDDGVGGDI